MNPIVRLCSVMPMVLASACAALSSAHVELPEPLAAQSAIVLQGPGPGRSGEFTLASERGRFERGADRLDVLDALALDRVTLRYATPATRAACRGRQTRLTLGVISGEPRAFEFQCSYDGSFAGQFTLRGTSGSRGIDAARQQRSGRLSAAGVTVDIVSLHRLQGSPLPLAAPAGYLLSIEGRPVGALELTDSTRPRVWLPPSPGAEQTAVMHAALTLALLWDPSQGVE